MSSIPAISANRPLSTSPRPAIVAPVGAPTRAPKTATGGWDRTSYLPAPGQLNPPPDAVARAKAIFSISEQKSQTEALQVGAFLESHPSRGADQVVFFHSYWTLQQTFQQVPLQAFLYSRTRPVDDQGRPKNALWQRYADLVETGASPRAIETAFFQAHIAEFKAVIRTPEFKQLYAFATPKYRRVVEAYLDTLAQSEAELDRGGDPAKTGRWLFSRTVAWLFKHKVWDNGFMATVHGAKAMAHVTSPLNRQFWGAFGHIAKSMVLDSGARHDAPTRVIVSLSAADAERLRQQTGIPFTAGRQELTEAMLAHAAIAEPERREHPVGPARTYRLELSDFLAPDRLHAGSFMAGPDGVMDAGEVDGVLRRVQGLARSQLIETFFQKYPVPHGGVHLYSANMLSMNGAYDGSVMANTLANAIMPVDNDGRPKNASWRAYVAASESHQSTGAPSEQVIESLWWKAHMEDFAIVETPAFKRLLADFWRQADKDPALKPLATYARAMVIGRENFERDRQTRSEDSAFVTFIGHFTRTIWDAHSFPFWRQDLAEASNWLRHPSQKRLDDRGLPTERTLFARSVEGLRMMVGLKGTIARGIQQDLTHQADRRPVSSMIDLAKVLTPAQLAQVDPRVVAFYRHPDTFDMTVGVDTTGAASGLILGRIAPLLSGMAKIPNRLKGSEAYPMETSLYQDAQGGTHWDRYAVVDGQRQPLFLAKFESAGRQLKETFHVHGQAIALYFNVTPYQGGLKLTLDKQKSNRLAATSEIAFTVLPSAAGLTTVGRFQDPTKTMGETFTMNMTPKQTPSLASRALVG